MKKKQPPKAIAKPLPKKFRGAEVVRGLGMNYKEFDTLVEKKAMDNFDATREMWLVIESRALEDPDDSVEVKAFADKADAIRIARAMANGNIDHRVLRVTEQVLVIATDNDL